MNSVHFNPCGQEEWSHFMEAACQVKKDIDAYECRLSAESLDPTNTNFNFTHTAPQFHYVEDANECIQRLWSICTQLTDRQQLMRDRIEQNSSNSSRPPSSDTIAAKVNRYRANHQNYKPTGRKQGAQLGHTGLAAIKADI